MPRKKKEVDPRILELLKNLTDAFGPSSFESDVRDVFRKEVRGYADDVCTCGLGSIIARRRGMAESPKIMIAGHMDEVGFMVRGISKGYVKFNPVGGWWGHVLLGQKVVIRTRKGKNVVGVIGAKAPHALSGDERKKVQEPEKMYIDIGSYDDYNAAEKMGIQIGDPIVPYSEFHVLGNGRMIMAKAWDDRIGVAAAIETLRQLKGLRHPNTIYAVGTVMEEVGLRGAGTSAFEIAPDVAFAVDVTLASDTPGADDSDFAEQCGKGPSISVMDGSLMPNPVLRDIVIETAEKEKIPYQLGSLTKGGTDGGRIAVTRSGIPSITLSVATRYIHSHHGILHVDDFTNLVKLLVATVKKLDRKTVEKIRNM